MSKKLLLQRMGKSAFFLTGFLVALLIRCSLHVVVRGSMAFDPMKNSLLERLQKPDWFSKGLSGHILGTDELGRDVLTRLLSGARISLLISAIVTASQIMLGTALGVLAGFLGGGVDIVIMRICDIFLALPSMLVAIALMAVLGASIPNLILILSITGWVQFCRVTRNNVKIIRGMEFVAAEQVMGASKFRIMLTRPPECDDRHHRSGQPAIWVYHFHRGNTQLLESWRCGSNAVMGQYDCRWTRIPVNLSLAHLRTGNCADGDRSGIQLSGGRFA